MSQIKQVLKRDGRKVDFDKIKITNSLFRAGSSTGEFDREEAEKLTERVLAVLESVFNSKEVPTVEDISDASELVLMRSKWRKTARAFILYRDEHAKNRKQLRPVPDEVRKLVRESKKYFANDLAEYVFYSTYSRWIPEKGRRETWVEAIDRYIGFMREKLGDKLKEEEYTEIREAMLNMDVLGSMRLLWAAGDAARKNNVMAFNCSFTGPVDWQDFGEICFLLMSGTGVGFSVERQFVEQLPFIQKQKNKKEIDCIIEDSKEGWADAIVFLMKSMADGLMVNFDYSKIRPQGARIKTSGGRSSGPEPLKSLLVFIKERFLQKQGGRLNSLDVHDIICKIGEVVVAGGSRRSALISLSDLDDQLMKTAKNGQFWVNNPHRMLSNNSAVYNSKPTIPEFMEEWLNLVKSGSGERGIQNRGGTINQIPERRKKINEEFFGKFGSNPCLPSWAPVLTRCGIKKLSEVGIGDEIWSESGFVKIINKQSTGIKSVYSFRTNSGIFYGTENHKIISNGNKIEVGSAENIDSLQYKISDDVEQNFEFNPDVIMDGLMIGDGSRHLASAEKVYLNIGINDKDYFEDKDIKDLIFGEHAACYGSAFKVKTSIVPEELLNTYERVIPDRYFYGDFVTVCSFLRGLFSANGSICGNRVTLKQTSKKMVEQVQIMLSSVGVGSYITKNKATSIKFSNGIYTTKPSYDINISSLHLNVFIERIGFIQKYKNDKLSNILSVDKKIPKITYDIISKKYLGDEEVFDITVDNLTHTYWTGGLNVSNCNEIVLRPKQFCNLSIIIARPEDTEKTLMNKIKIATILGTYQASLTDFKYLSSEWKKNSDEEALLGVSIDGQWDCELVRNPRVLQKMREYSIEVNKEYAKRFGINPSTAITCVKPSGNGSSLFNSSPGCHPRHSQYYIRRVRVEAHSPLFHMLKDIGVPYHPEVGQEEATARTFVIEFPIKSPRGAVVKRDLSAIDMLEHWRVVKTKFTDHNPSITTHVKDDEWFRVGSWVYDNWDIVGGLSFLPLDNHVYQLAPYSEITKEEYEKLSAAFPKLDFSEINAWEYEDNTESAKELACSSGFCEL